VAEAPAVDGDVWAMGGAEIYRVAMPFAELAVITELREEFEGDAHAPVLDTTWLAVATDPADGWYESATGLHYRFRTLRRR